MVAMEDESSGRADTSVTDPNREEVTPAVITSSPRQSDNPANITPAQQQPAEASQLTALTESSEQQHQTLLNDDQLQAHLSHLSEPFETTYVRESVREAAQLEQLSTESAQFEASERATQLETDRAEPSAPPPQEMDTRPTRALLPEPSEENNRLAMTPMQFIQVPVGQIDGQQQQQTRTRRTSRLPYMQKRGHYLAVMQLINGSACILLQILLWHYVIDYCPACTGLIYVPSGIIGLMAARKSNRCLIITFMVLSIISSVFAVPGFSFACVNADTYFRGCCRPSSYADDLSSNEHKRAWVVVPVFMAFFHLTELVVAIMSAGLCCKAVCCGPFGERQPTVVYLAQPMDGATATGREVLYTFPSESLQGFLVTRPNEPPPYTDEPSQPPPYNRLTQHNNDK